MLTPLFTYRNLGEREDWMNNFHNPIVMQKGGSHEEVCLLMNKLKNKMNLLFNMGVSSTSGYSTYTKSGIIPEFGDIEQQITLAISPILGSGLFIGFRYMISYIEWSKYGGQINAGIIDNFVELYDYLYQIQQMSKGSEEDRQLANSIIRNNFLGLLK